MNGAQVSDRRVQSAREGAYVELDAFLPDTGPPPETRKDRGKKKKHRERIHDYYSWLVAYTGFIDAVLTKHPDLWKELIQYRVILSEFDVRYNWSAVQMYDLKFRSQMACSKSLKFGHIDTDIMLLTLTPDTLKDTTRTCYRCKSALHVAKKCHFQEECPLEAAPTDTPKSSKFNSFQNKFKNKSSSSFANEVCHKYNQGTCMYGERCYRQHKCILCGNRAPIFSCSTCSRTLVKSNIPQSGTMPSASSFNPYATPFNFSVPPPQGGVAKLHGSTPQ